MICGLITFLLIGNVFWDLSWFLRYIFIVNFTRTFRKKLNVKEKTTLYGEIDSDGYNDEKSLRRLF